MAGDVKYFDIFDLHARKVAHRIVSSALHDAARIRRNQLAGGLNRDMKIVELSYTDVYNFVAKTVAFDAVEFTFNVEIGDRHVKILAVRTPINGTPGEAVQVEYQELFSADHEDKVAELSVRVAQAFQKAIDVVEVKNGEDRDFTTGNASPRRGDYDSMAEYIASFKPEMLPAEVSANLKEVSEKFAFDSPTDTSIEDLLGDVN
jgi:hypothetical protein